MRRGGPGARSVGVVVLVALAAVAGRARAQAPDSGLVVDPLALGARGDARVAIGCSMTRGSAVLMCAGGHFTASAVGKVIAVYGAGAPAKGFVPPLSTTIAAFASPDRVTLAAPAATSVERSERVVWGTDDTHALQAAVDALAAPDGVGGNVGGVLRLPARHFLTRGIDLPCAKVGRFDGGVCTRTYHGIRLVGAGRTATTLENWDVTAPYAEHPGVVSLGARSNLSTREPANAPLTDIVVSDLTLRQVAHPRESLKVIEDNGTDTVTVARTVGIGPSHECYRMNVSTRWTVTDNVLGPCGRGGPADPRFIAALNLSGQIWTATGNTVVASGVGMEIGGNRWLVRDNVLDGAERPQPGGAIGISIGNTGVGVWEGVVRSNVIRDYPNGLSSGNTLGTFNRLRIVDNTWINGAVGIASGLEHNLFARPCAGCREWFAADTVVHGISEISGNVFYFDTLSPNPPIQIGGPGSALESAVVARNTVVYASAFLVGGPHHGRPCRRDADDPSGAARCRIGPGFITVAGPLGGPAWRPDTHYAASAPVAPVVHNGSYYTAARAGRSGPVEPAWPTTAGAVVSDGEVTWVNRGPRPWTSVVDNVVHGPAGATTMGIDVRLNDGTSRDVVTVAGLSFDYAWRLQPTEPGAHAEEVPASVPYSDCRRWAPGRPTHGTYALGCEVRITPTGERLTVVRAGRAGAPWSPRAIYRYASVVVPSVDNGRVYYQAKSDGCTSAATPPRFPTVPGARVSDNDCVWRDAGPAVLWHR